MSCKTPRTIWVTGASSGIGEALVKLLDSNGHCVIATARNADKLNALTSQGVNITPLVADLCNDKDLLRIKEFFKGRHVDIAVINAGSCEYMQDGNLDVSSLRRVYEINFFAAAQSIQAVLPALKNTERGHIIGVSSMSVYLPFSKASYYASSKAALSSYLNCLAVDIYPDNIDVSVVYPGFVKTPLTDKNNFPMPFIISAEKAAEYFLTVIEKRPRVYAFPKNMDYLLKFFQKIPNIWFNQQVSKKIKA